MNWLTRLFTSNLAMVLSSKQSWPHLYFDGMREGYRDLPAEHRESSTYTTFEEGTYKVYVLTVGRVEAFAAQYIEQTAGNPAMSPELD